MINRQELKETAKQSLNSIPGQWTKGGLIFIALLIVYESVVSLALCVPFVGLLCYTIAFLIGSALLTIIPIKASIQLLKKETFDFAYILNNYELILKMIGLTLVMGLFVFFWSLLLFIPGIIKTYSYAMAPYILIEDPSIGIIEAITKSRQMMNGHKMNYFVLMLSFIGWGILTVLTFFVGYIWLVPYIQVTNAAFYLQIKNSAA